MVYNTGIIERPDFIGNYLKRIKPPKKTNRWKKLKEKFASKSYGHDLTEQEKNRMFFTMRNQFSIIDTHLDDFIKNAPDEIKIEFRKELAEINWLLKKKKMTATRMAEFLNDWHETVEIYSDIEIVKEIESAKRDFSEGECVSWQPGMFLKLS